MNRFFQAIMATGAVECLVSLFVHRFIYADERTWWTQHRLGPAIGTAIAMFGAALSRHYLRDTVDGADTAEKRHLSIAMDWLATLGAAAAAAIGIVLADMMREWFSDDDQRNAGMNQASPAGDARRDEWPPVP